MDAPHLPPPQKEQHMDDVFSATCVGSCGAVVHKCARLCFGCAQFVHVCRFRLCTVCTVCRMSSEPWRRFSASVLRSVRTFAECVGLCRRTRRASGTSRRIGDLCACQEKTAPDRISARGAKAEPAPNPGAFSVRGRPGADLAGFGQIWRPGGYSN